MASSDVQRKLTAILCADVVGYSRLMGENEPATVRTLTEYRQVFADYIEKFQGRVVNAPGDSILAEFGRLLGVSDSSGFSWRGDPHGDRRADNCERADREWESIAAGAVE